MSWICLFLIPFHIFLKDIHSFPFIELSLFFHFHLFHLSQKIYTKKTPKFELSHFWSKWRPMEEISEPKNSLCEPKRNRKTRRGLNQRFLSSKQRKREREKNNNNNRKLNVCLLFFLSISYPFIADLSLFLSLFRFLL